MDLESILFRLLVVMIIIMMFFLSVIIGVISIGLVTGDITLTNTLGGCTC